MCFASGLSTLMRASRYFNPESLGTWARDTVRDVGVVTGCLLACERSLWDRLGGFDERFFMYGEDTDLSLRAAELGYLPQITPAATITHVVGASSGSGGDKMAMIMRARVTLMYKHWTPLQRRLGVALLRAGVVLRASGSAAKARLRRPGSSAMWPEVWRQRSRWTRPYQVDDPGDGVTPPRSRRIQLWTYNYDPEPSGIAPLSSSLARGLARPEAMSFAVVAAHPHYPGRSGVTRARPYRERRDGIERPAPAASWIGRSATAKERLRQERRSSRAQLIAPILSQGPTLSSRRPRASPRSRPR